MTKLFPKSRICVIDIYPSFERGLKAATDFAKKYSISLNSSDGKKLILGYCLKTIETTYKDTKSPFPKVICISNKAITKKVSTFIDTHFTQMMDYFPAPYCGKFDLNSPDLESAAESSLKQIKPKRRLDELFIKLKIKVN
jgi:hypothetical protein